MVSSIVDNKLPKSAWWFRVLLILAWLPPVAMLSVGVAVFAAAQPDSGEHGRQQPASGAVSKDGAQAPAVSIVRMVIDYGNGVEKHYTRVPHREGMTVLDVMEFAKTLKPGLSFEYSGRNRTALLRSIDGLANQGGGSESRNWVFRVNGALADKSFAIYRLQSGDVVLWRYDVYKPK